jgi:vancomycin resistance protein VanJ
VLLVGDMNVTEREPAYADLQTPLLDAHTQVGRGWGHTWRLGGLPLLRIDYLLASPDIVPAWIKADCSAPESDHCSLVGQFALPVDR